MTDKKYKTTYTYGPPEILVCSIHGEQNDPYTFKHNGTIVGTFCTKCMCDVLQDMSSLHNDAIEVEPTINTSATDV
jgi:hypothetical protein